MWKWTILLCAVIGIAAAIVLIFKQSSDERDLGKKLDKLLNERGLQPDAISDSSLSSTKSELPQSPDVDGEIYRMAISPRTMSWELLRDIYRIQGATEDAKVDCDVLVEMYLVNRSKTETRYIRDLRLSAVIKGQIVNLQAQPDLSAIDFNNIPYEYGLELKKFGKAETIKQLYSMLPVALSPEQPIEGWVRFLAKDVNPDDIEDKSWKLNALDSVGKEYPITKVAVGRERKGEITLRRRLGS